MSAKPLAVVSMLVASFAFAGDCEDTAFACQDDCIIRHGHSTKAEVKERFSRCSNACATALHACANKRNDVKRNQLEPAALDTPDAGTRRQPIDDDDLRNH